MKKLNRRTLKLKIRKLIRFIKYDIWRVTEGEVAKSRGIFYNAIKTVIVSVRNQKADQIATKASALTYSTLLSIVPMLAVIFAIARGFGFQQILNSQLMSYFEGQETIIENLLGFVDNYLEHAKGGIFTGIGIVLLLVTIFNLITNIEQAFNTVWQVKRPRSYYRKITDYFSFVLILPIFIIFSSGISLFISSTVSSTSGLSIFSPVVGSFLNLLPYFSMVFVFFLIYKFVPNVKVETKKAILPAILAGTAFQIFQMLYISGQIWISKYNAIYGSFAALPLLLLWLQISWTICLLGVELCFVSQNLNRFSFESETKTISRRYYDFLSLVIMSLIIKRFDEGETPCTSVEISDKHKIPIGLTNDILNFLEELNLLRETLSEDEREPAYLPAIDTHKISVAFLLDKIDKHGSEGFKIDKADTLKKEWETILDAKRHQYEQNKDLLIRDL